MSQDPLDKFKKSHTSEGTFDEAKAEPSWLKKAMQHGFKKFKENPDEHTIAAIGLEDINKAKPDPNEKFRPSWRDQVNTKSGSFAQSFKEFTGMKRISREFLEEEKVRKNKQATALKRGAGNLGHYNSVDSSKTKFIVLGLVLLMGFGGYRVTRKWLETSDSLMAKVISQKIESATGKKFGKPRKNDLKEKLLERDRQLKGTEIDELK